MIEFIDEVLSGMPVYRITHQDNSTENVSIDLVTTVTTQGTPLNKVLFDSIKDDLNSRLLISSKATQVQAEAGTDNTNYMTVLRTKQFCAKNVGVKKTLIELSTSGTNTIDLTQYLNDNVRKLEVIFDTRFGSSYRGITVNADTIRVNYPRK